ncbi:MAG: PIN domain-containing protein [Nitrospinota bacterium]|nr:MAG: PIN domain-containing protein [Nitrospinota bacterium]
MILYFDASAIVKRYVAEPGSEEVQALLAKAEVVGTGIVSRVEVAATLAQAVRMRALSQKEAAVALDYFSAEWIRFNRLQPTEQVVAQASTLAWEQGLRGYDAVHLACALFWKEMLGKSVCMVTYDRQLWEASRRAGLEVFPGERP